MLGISRYWISRSMIRKRLAADCWRKQSMSLPRPLSAYGIRKCRPTWQRRLGRARPQDGNGSDYVDTGSLGSATMQWAARNHLRDARIAISKTRQHQIRQFIDDHRDVTNFRDDGLPELTISSSTLQTDRSGYSFTGHDGNSDYFRRRNTGLKETCYGRRYLVRWRFLHCHGDSGTVSLNTGASVTADIQVV